MPDTPSSSRPYSARKSVNAPSKRLSSPLNTRDELLMSLMASEAVIDSRDFPILTAEEVEELKKEHQVLTSRVEALSKKLALETKIRDAALNLSRVNASHKQVSKQTADQLAAANTRVDNAQTELWRVSDRLNDVHSRLMEHRAGVLSFSVRSMEKKMGATGTAEDSGYDSSNRSTLLSPATTATSVSSSMMGLGSPSQARFDGAHLFAGHADTIVPKRKLSAEAAAAEILALEAKLKQAKDALSSASKKQVEMTRELSMMRLEKQEVETIMDMDLQAAQDTIAALESELPKAQQLDGEMDTLRREKEAWQREKMAWQRERDDLSQREREKDAKKDKEAEEWSRRLADAERRQGERETDTQRELEERDGEIQRLRDEMDAMRVGWEEERQIWEDEKLEDLARLQEEMDAARRVSQSQSSSAAERDRQRTNEELEAGLLAVQVMVKTHGIVLFSRDSSLQGLLNAIGMHLDSVHTRLEAHAKAEAEWDTLRRRLEEDVRGGLDRREAMARELEEARKERDVARRERESAGFEGEKRGRGQSVSQQQHMRNLSSSEGVNGNGESVDTARINAVLQPLWAVLPSPEARAAKFGAGSSSSRTYRTGSPTPMSPGGSSSNTSSSGVVASLSDLDVRSLKALYDTRNTPSSPRPGSNNSNAAPFSIDAFAARVQALMADDRALIERLVRFAQAHDLLKKNAERAQKLAQDGTHALETYQKQVRTLEERNQGMGGRVVALQEELQLLHDTIERLTSEKHELEALAGEQAETCRQLTEANNTLSARTLTLAEEAAAAPEMVRKILEVQIGELKTQIAALEKTGAEMKKELEDARDEVDGMRSSEQSQRIALLDELNSMQTENGTLRAQLRALKK
ncbi:hypothetical protein GALMADRAFT_262408 [Galerina marginata CBS 339.88]|uniref:Up-regulated during septation protein 1 domain-containing protein n=1 Tax=Galerina marginata (strain CBS 339.88) TaxID=685588 RepID=A0A067TYD5_GALM3|nr:hypothetical protein GALMADRAFT_262408 [Galerina marginata CBS 339.88]